VYGAGGTIQAVLKVHPDYFSWQAAATSWYGGVYKAANITQTSIHASFGNYPIDLDTVRAGASFGAWGGTSTVATAPSLLIQTMASFGAQQQSTSSLSTTSQNTAVVPDLFAANPLHHG
jgi:hypothetical protein